MAATRKYAPRKKSAIKVEPNLRHVWLASLGLLVAARRESKAAAQRATAKAEGAIADARPGLQTFSQTTIPEANALIRDLRRTSASLSSLTDKLDQQGAGAVLGGSKLPDYKQ